MIATFTRKLKEHKALLPLLVLSAFSVGALVSAITGTAMMAGETYRFSLKVMHYVGFAAIVINGAVYFFRRHFYKYTLGLTLLLGIFNLISFSALETTIGFGINSLKVSVQFTSFLAGLLAYLVYFKRVNDLIKDQLVTKHTPEERAHYAKTTSNEEIEKFKERYKTHSDERLSEILANNKYLPEAHEAAKQVVEARKSKPTESHAWTHRNTQAIGGLENIGYAPKQDLLLVLSSQGQGIFNCKTGEKVARKEGEWWEEFDQTTHSLLGFDMLANVEIETCGLHGEDTLSKSTADHWTLRVSEPEPDDSPFEMHTVKSIYLVSPDKKEKTRVGKDGACELRAFGFSETGESFVIALSCEVIIFSRA